MCFQKNNPKTLLEIKETSNKKINKLVYESAIKLFNKKYNSNTLSNINNELIQDYLSYKTQDAFKKSLIKRLKTINEQLAKFKYKEDIQGVKQLCENVNEYKEHLIEVDNFGVVIKHISDFYDVLNNVSEFYKNIGDK